MHNYYRFLISHLKIDFQQDNNFMISIIISLSKKNCSRNSGSHGEIRVFYYSVFRNRLLSFRSKKNILCATNSTFKKNFSKVFQTKCRRGGHMAGNKVWHTNTKKDKVIKIGTGAANNTVDIGLP